MGRAAWNKLDDDDEKNLLSDVIIAISSHGQRQSISGRRFTGTRNGRWPAAAIFTNKGTEIVVSYMYINVTINIDSSIVWFIKADEKAKLQSVLNKAVRYRFLTNYKPVEYLFQSPDTTLFSVILRRPGHVLHPLLPPLNTTGYHLRKRNHGLKLSTV